MKKMINTIMARGRSLLINSEDLLNILETIEQVNNCHPVMDISKSREFEGDPSWLVDFRMTDRKWNEFLQTKGYEFVLMTDNYVRVKRVAA